MSDCPPSQSRIRGKLEPADRVARDRFILPGSKWGGEACRLGMKESRGSGYLRLPAPSLALTISIPLPKTGSSPDRSLIPAVCAEKGIPNQPPALIGSAGESHARLPRVQRLHRRFQAEGDWFESNLKSRIRSSRLLWLVSGIGTDWGIAAGTALRPADSAHPPVSTAATLHASLRLDSPNRSSQPSRRIPVRFPSSFAPPQRHGIGRRFPAPDRYRIAHWVR